ncbi:hypothetical protein KC343_g4673, partial [Hortaea werneckii]
KRRIGSIDADDDAGLKRQRTEGEGAPPPPPPPPPPPAGDPDVDQEMLTPNEDVSASFTHEALASVHDATIAEKHAHGEPFVAAGAQDPPHASPHRKSEFNTAMQTATPPTTGSPEREEARKGNPAERQNLTGMNPDRMRQLGLLNGASD